MVQEGTAYHHTYDKRGNLTEERQGDSLIRQYIYDAANCMVTGKDILSGIQTDYTYNALNMRVGNTVTPAQRHRIRKKLYMYPMF